jgi:integrase/recombinase XerC/integrase/recombinase XerD
LNYCIDENYCSPDVLRKVKFLKSDQEEIIPLSDWEVDEIDGLFNYRTESGIRNLCIVHLMLDAGFRHSDVVNLMYSNINFNNNYLMIKGKGNKYRSVPLCPKLKKMLSHYIIKFRSYAPGDDFPVFVNVGTQEPITSDCIKQLFVRIKKKTGIDRVHPHLLRHTFATSYIIGGGNIEFLRLMLGHEDYETTKLYLHLAQESKMLNLSIYKLDPVFFKSGY